MNEVDKCKDDIVYLLEKGKLNTLEDNNKIVHTFIKVYTYLGKDCNYLIECTKLIMLNKKLYKTIKEMAYGLRE